MKKWFFLSLVLLLSLPGQASARHGQPGRWHTSFEIGPDGDTISVVPIKPVFVFSKKADLRRYRKLVEAVKKVYPVAQAAKAQMVQMEAETAPARNEKGTETIHQRQSPQRSKFLISSLMSSLNQSRESEKRNRHQSGCYQHDRSSLKGFRNIIVLDFFTDSSHQYDCNQESTAVATPLTRPHQCYKISAHLSVQLRVPHSWL